MPNEPMKRIRMFPQALPIKDKKFQDLQSMKHVIPVECHHFFDNLPHSYLTFQMIAAAWLQDFPNPVIQHAISIHHYPSLGFGLFTVYSDSVQPRISAKQSCPFFHTIFFPIVLLCTIGTVVVRFLAFVVP